MTLTEEEFFTYMNCPVKYDGIYNKKIIPPKQLSMQSLLSSVAKRFYIKLMNGTVMTTSQLKNTWDKLCEQSGEWMTPKKAIRGINEIMKLYNWAKGEQLQIADIGTPFNIPVKCDTGAINFSGEIPALSFMPNKKLEILITDFGRNIPDRFFMDMNLKYSIYIYAVLNGAGKDAGLHVHHVASNKDFYVYRTRNDFIRFKDAIRNVYKGITSKLFYPHENTYCVSCELKGFCRGWHNS